MGSIPIIGSAVFARLHSVPSCLTLAFVGFGLLTRPHPVGVCAKRFQADSDSRSVSHLAVAFCRCMNIPARYCTGYLGDIGVPSEGPMDLAACFEAFLDNHWYTFDPRNDTPRIGRVLIARGRDAGDVAQHYVRSQHTGGL